MTSGGKPLPLCCLITCLMTLLHVASSSWLSQMKAEKVFHPPRASSTLRAHRWSLSFTLLPMGPFTGRRNLTLQGIINLIHLSPNAAAGVSFEEREVPPSPPPLLARPSGRNTVHPCMTTQQKKKVLHCSIALNTHVRMGTLEAKCSLILNVLQNNDTGLTGLADHT